MNSGSLAFWRVVKLLQQEIDSNPLAADVLKKDPIVFLQQRQLDAAIDSGSTESMSLVSLLERADASQRAAIVESLLSLSSKITPSRTIKLAGSNAFGDIDDNGFLGDFLVGVLANVNVFINANAVENANALSNINANSLANANQAANANANANANININVNSTGIGSTYDPRGVPMAKNNMLISMPANYSSSALANELKSLRLSDSRQKALLKRAILDSPKFNLLDREQLANMHSFNYQYRHVKFSLDARVVGSSLIVEKGTLL